MFEHLGILSSHLIQFEIYSSRTGTWRTLSAQPYPQHVNVQMGNGMDCNGSVYWMSEASADSLYFNVDEERLESFLGPPISLNSSSRRSLYLGESEDHLHVIEVRRYTTLFDVYEMKSDLSGWFVKFKVDLAEIFQVFPQMTGNIHPLDDGNGYVVNLLTLVSSNKFQEDFVILDVPGRATRYNLADGSFKEILDYAKMESSVRNLPCGGIRVWQYIESLSPV